MTSSRTSSPWIITRATDLAWFQGSVLPALGLLALFRLVPRLDPHDAAAPAALILLAWGVLFDGTHVLGTYARSYLAPDDASRAGLPGAWSFALVLLGPAVALADGAAGTRLFPWFLLGAYLYAYWHLVRQHYGFVALYRRRDDCDPIDRRIEDALLWIGCLHPYLRFSLSPSFRQTGLPVLVDAELAPTLRVLLDATAILALVGGVALLAHRDRTRPGPRHLLIAIVVAFHELVFASLDQLVPITATLTLFHNLQYHRIVWQHERGKGRVPLGHVGRYLGLGMLLGLVWYGARITGAALASTTVVREALLGFGWGVAFHHYLVDGRIWRVRRQPAVGRAIDVAAEAS